MSKPAKVIDLDRFRSDSVRVFTGRERGRAVRKAAKLDELDHSKGEVQIHIPDDVFSMASSFFLGMFGPSVRELGAEGFREKYHFVGPSVDIILEDGIREALSRQSPLE